LMQSPSLVALAHERDARAYILVAAIFREYSTRAALPR
jgi:hypothetical protein